MDKIWVITLAIIITLFILVLIIASIDSPRVTYKPKYMYNICTLNKCYEANRFKEYGGCVMFGDEGKESTICGLYSVIKEYRE